MIAAQANKMAHLIDGRGDDFTYLSFDRVKVSSVDGLNEADVARHMLTIERHMHMRAKYESLKGR